MTQEEFEQKFGPPAIAKEANEALQGCVDNIDGVKLKNQPALFTGTVWNIGYLRKSLDPSQTEFNYGLIAADLAFVQALADILRECREVSDSDCPYYPFRMELGKADYASTDDLLTDFVQALGHEERAGSAIHPDGDYFSLWSVDKGSKFIFTQLGEYEPEEISEYLSESEIVAHKQADTFMRQHFKKIYKFSIGYKSRYRFCVTYPIFVFGITPQGTALGTFTVRTDT